MRKSFLGVHSSQSFHDAARAEFVATYQAIKSLFGMESNPSGTGSPHQSHHHNKLGWHAQPQAHYGRWQEWDRVFHHLEGWPRVRRHVNLEATDRCSLSHMCRQDSIGLPTLGYTGMWHLFLCKLASSPSRFRGSLHSLRVSLRQSRLSTSQSQDDQNKPGPSLGQERSPVACLSHRIEHSV